MTAFDYDALEAAGFETVVVKYNGAGDEGYIDEIESSPEDEGLEYKSPLYDAIEMAAYDVLERHHGGWEINEGSSGHITINVKDRKALIHHGERYEQQTWSDTEV